MVVCRVDDILISGKNDREHLIHLNEVLARLKRADLRLKLSKCKFMQPTVEFLGYRIDAQGIHAIEKSRSHKKGARTRKSASVEVIPRNDQLLFKIHQ